MKKLIILTLCILSTVVCAAQNNPYKMFGYEVDSTKTFGVEAEPKTEVFYLYNSDTLSEVRFLAFVFSKRVVASFDAEGNLIDISRFKETDVALSPDPMWHKYPHLTPYHYCSNNPIMRVDPNGMEDDWYEYKDKDGNTHAIWLKNNQSPTYTDENGNIWSNVGVSYDIGGYILEQHQNSEGEYYLKGVKTGDYSTPWIDIALKEYKIGVEEIEGAVHNSRILEYHSTTGLKAKTDETPWCSSFVNWCFKEAGIQGTNSAAASSWGTWGQDLGQNPAYGSVGIQMQNGKMSHVGFTIGYTSSGGIKLLGGNQQNMVKISTYSSKAKFANFRYPIGYTPKYLQK